MYAAILLVSLVGHSQPEAPPPEAAPPEAASPTEVAEPTEAPSADVDAPATPEDPNAEAVPDVAPEPELAPTPAPAPTAEEDEFVTPPEDEDPPPEPEPEPDPWDEPAPEEEIATLQPAAPDRTKRPKPKSLYGRLWAGPVLGASSSSVALGASATYFVVPYVGVGAELVNVFAWSPNYYEFQFTPQITLLALPRRRFSPIAWGGFGVDTFNKGLGTYGRWNAGGGFIMLLGRRMILTLGVEVDGRIPVSRWNDVFACGPFKSNCSMGIGPALGLAFPFG